MKTNLVATFTNSQGSRHDWTYKELKADLPIPVIKEACELMTSLDIFEKDGVKLFDSLITAKIVSTTETIIFDKTNESPIEENIPCEKKQSVETPANTNKAIDSSAGRLLEAANPIVPNFRGSEALRKEPSAAAPSIPASASLFPVAPTQYLQEYRHQSESLKTTEMETPGERQSGHSADPINASPNSEPHSQENGHRLKQVLAQFWKKRTAHKHDPHINEVKKE